MSAFQEHTGFYLNDNRKNRGANPITKAVLEAKCSVLLPAWLVKNKTVLDLGSCMGAAGQWSLFHGAKSYTGVEVQEGYVKESSELLSHWGDRAKVVKSDIRSFLKKTDPGSYDIIVAAGVLYLFIDPEAIVAQMCKAASYAVVIESNYPAATRKGGVADQDMITQYSFSREVNIADSNHSLSGIAASSSPQAFDLFFKLNDFDNKENLLKFPVSPETVVYTDYARALEEKSLPARFAARYFRSREPRLRTLEENFPLGIGKRRDWDTDPFHQSAKKQYNEVAEKIRKAGQNHLGQNQNGQKWEFDKEVAASFNQIAEKSIPHYHRVIDMAVEILKKKNYPNPKIIDVGSAIGATLERLHQNGFRNLYGVDNSAAMLEKSFKEATLIQAEDFPSDAGPFDCVIANWVLHFIDKREEYITDIRNALAPGGILIISDKVAHSEFALSLYHDFKRKNGLTEEEIEKKAKQLVGVLTPFPLSWYFTLLNNLGFKHIEVIDADYCFVTLMAQL